MKIIKEEVAEEMAKFEKKNLVYRHDRVLSLSLERMDEIKRR